MIDDRQRHPDNILWTGIEGYDRCTPSATPLLNCVAYRNPIKFPLLWCFEPVTVKKTNEAKICTVEHSFVMKSPMKVRWSQQWASHLSTPGAVFARREENMQAGVQSRKIPGPVVPIGGLILRIGNIHNCTAQSQKRWVIVTWAWKHCLRKAGFGSKWVDAQYRWEAEWGHGISLAMSGGVLVSVAVGTRSTTLA